MLTLLVIDHKLFHFLSHLIYVECYTCLLQFLETGPELGNNYTEVIAAQDVATYGGLCALASFDRTELKVTSINYFHVILLTD